MAGEWVQRERSAVEALVRAAAPPHSLVSSPWWRGWQLYSRGLAGGTPGPVQRPPSLALLGRPPLPSLDYRALPSAAADLLLSLHGGSCAPAPEGCACEPELLLAPGDGAADVLVAPEPFARPRDAVAVAVPAGCSVAGLWRRLAGALRAREGAALCWKRLGDPPFARPRDAVAVAVPAGCSVAGLWRRLAGALRAREGAALCWKRLGDPVFLWQPLCPGGDAGSDTRTLEEAGIDEGCEVGVVDLRRLRAEEQAQQDSVQAAASWRESCRAMSDEARRRRAREASALEARAPAECSLLSCLASDDGSSSSSSRDAGKRTERRAATEEERRRLVQQRRDIVMRMRAQTGLEDDGQEGEGAPV
eukprot:m51a1_g7393 hypothetical protein (362) ;mRNA; r:139150-141974